uniref:Uncharacterized protein n=1 Tax=Brassica campestris TaxID=3711 RepID=A0A3P6CTX1_BRACM|nr:unnamed protein product [Brassica rapa]
MRTQWHKWWNSLEMRILQLIYDVGLGNNSYLNNYFILGCIETNKKVKSFWLGLNEFADLSHEEFKNEYLGLKTDIERGDDERSYQEFAYKDVDVETLPKSSIAIFFFLKCYAGSYKQNCDRKLVEGINKIVTGNLTILSEQELIDCESVSL